MSTTTIHYVRHGNVQNPNKIAYGRMSGFPLSGKGKKKATKVGEFFKGKNIRVIYTSPLERTFETANIISDSFTKPPKVIHKYELIEIDAKKWQSFPIDELYQNKYFESFVNNPKSKEVPENLYELGKRMEDFTLGLCKKHTGEEIICVSHEYPIIVLRLKLEGKPLIDSKTLDVSTASITTFQLNEDCKLVDINYRDFE